MIIFSYQHSEKYVEFLLRGNEMKMNREFKMRKFEISAFNIVYVGFI